MKIRYEACLVCIAGIEWSSFKNFSCLCYQMLELKLKSFPHHLTCPLHQPIQFINLSTSSIYPLHQIYQPDTTHYLKWRLPCEVSSRLLGPRLVMRVVLNHYHKQVSPSVPADGNISANNILTSPTEV